MAVIILLGLVTKRSSPTICIWVSAVRFFGFWILEVKIILAIFEELTSSNIHTNFNLAFIPRLLNRLN